MSVAATALTIAIAFPFAYWLVRYVPQAPAEGRCSCSSSCRSGRATCCASTRGSTSSATQGAINRFLQWTQLTDHPLSFFLYDRPAVILVLVYLYFPFAALTLYASLERFDWDQFKAAMDLGAHAAHARSREILLPQIKPGITTARDLRLHPDPRRVPDAAARRRRARA